MDVRPPDWLTRRGGTLQAGCLSSALFVLFEGEPQYRVEPIPVAGQFGCEVRQTINGRRLEKGTAYPTADEAVRGGLEDLRAALGWA